jgi:hypothetical protein
MNFDVKDGFLYLHDDICSFSFRNFYGDDKYTDAQKEKVFIADIDSKGRVDIILLVEKTNVFLPGFGHWGKYTGIDQRRQRRIAKNL